MPTSTSIEAELERRRVRRLRERLEKLGDPDWPPEANADYHRWVRSHWTADIAVP